MPTFALQERLCKSLIAERPTIIAGMKTVMAAIRAAPGGKPWADIPTPNWNDLEARWVEWFDQLLRDLPPPRTTELLWFEAPDFYNQPITSVSGYAKLDTVDEEFGLGASRHWPIDVSGETFERGILNLPELDPLLAPLADDTITNDRVETCALVLTGCVTVLMVMNGLPRTRVLDALGVESIGVLTGWAAGGFERVGKLSRTGWSPLRRTRSSRSGASLKPPAPPRWSSEILKYLRAGGDPAYVNPENGETLMMMSRHEDVAFIKKLLKAGVRAEGRDNKGREVLHHFGADDLNVLQLLVDAGANPSAISGLPGESVMDDLFRDGRSTADHLGWCWDLGGRFHKYQEFPIHVSAAFPGLHQDSCVRTTAKVRWLVQKGYDLEAKDSTGLNPLWCSLSLHMRELMSLQNRLMLGVPHLYEYDATAIALLKAGADPNARFQGSSDSGIPSKATPLMVPRYDDARLFRSLLEHGADASLRCAAGLTALDYSRKALERPDSFFHKKAAKVVAMLENASDT